MLESRLDIRVEWGHCDPARIVYNPNFYDWMEAGLLALFEAAHLSLTAMVAEMPEFRGTPLVKGEATFMAPAMVGDVILLSSRVLRLGGASLDIAHVFTRGDTRLVEAAQTRVWGVSPPGEPERLTTARIPQHVRDALSEERVSHLRYVRD
jgi:4-hydroxybenzoyl-CoA thioesterase